MEQLTNTYPQSQRDTNEFIPSALTVRQGNGGGHPDSLRLSQQKALALSTTSHAMKDRLRAKNRNELQLAQQLQNSRSNKVVLQNQIELERQNRDLIQRELRDIQGQLNSLRQRYDDKSKKEIETLKKLGKAEIDLKDVNTRLDDAKEAESRARRAADQLRTRASRLEKDLFQVRFEHSNLTNALASEQRIAKSLRDNLEKQTDEYLAETQELRAERSNLSKKLAASDKEIANLQAQLSSAEEQIQELTDHMHLNDEEHLKEMHSLGQRLRDSEDANTDLSARADRQTQHIALLEQQLEDERHRALDLEQHLHNQKQVEGEMGKAMNAVRAQVKVMDERLSDKTRAVSSLVETTEMARSDAAVLQMQNENLQSALTNCQARLNQEANEKASLAQKLADAQEAVRQAEGKVEAVSHAKSEADKQLAEVTAAKNAAEVENSGLNTRLGQMQEEMSAANENISRLESLVEARDGDIDRLFAEKKTESSEHDYYSHTTELRMRDLENQVQSQNEVIERQATALEQAEAREGAARSANGQLQEDATEVQQRLQSALSTAETQLALVTSELQDSKDGMAMLQQDLDREIDTTAQLRQQIASMERENQQAKHQAAEEISNLKVALAAQQDANNQLSEESAEMADELAGLKDKSAHQAAELDKQHSQINEQNLRIGQLEDLLQSTNDNLAQRQDQVAEMQRSLALLQERLDAKTNAEADVNRSNTELQGDIEVLQQKLGDSQATNAKLEDQLSAERANGAQLEETIQLNEEQHMKDAHTVKMTILGLQRALMDKVNQADRLSLQLESVLKKSAEFEELIANAKATAQDARDQAERRTAELSSENTELSVAIDAINNDITALRDQLARSQERNAQLAGANQDLKSELEIARDAQSAKEAESKSLDDKLQLKSAKEKDLQNEVDEKTSALDEAQYQLRETKARLDYQKGRIGQLEDEVVEAQRKLRERRQIERRLLAQLEAGAPGSTAEGHGDLGNIDPAELRNKLEESEANRAELSAKMLEILRQQNDDEPDVP